MALHECMRQLPARLGQPASAALCTAFVVLQLSRVSSEPPSRPSVAAARPGRPSRVLQLLGGSGAMSLTRKSRSISYARRGWSVGTMWPQPRSITYEKVALCTEDA